MTKREKRLVVIALLALWLTVALLGWMVWNNAVHDNWNNDRMLSRNLHLRDRVEALEDHTGLVEPGERIMSVEQLYAEIERAYKKE